MKKIIGRMGRNMLLLVLLVTAITSQLCSCGNADETSTPGGFSISGQITSGNSGLAGVTITLSGTAEGMTTSGAAGNYTFSGLVNGSYTLTPSQTGFTFSPSSQAQTINSANVTAVNFIATPSTLPTFTISGTVTSVGSGSGLPGVIMTLSGTGSATASTDAAGKYAFSGLVNGGYTVTPSAFGFTFNPISSPLIVNSANITNVNFGAVVATVPLVPCPASGTINVTIQDFFYTPSPITVGVNSIVKWTNEGLTAHTVTSGITPNLDGKFNSGTMGNGVTVCYQFLATGTYPYFCTIHPNMSGSVVVQ